MTSITVLSLLRDRYNFLRPAKEELERLVHHFERRLPIPQRIFLDDEEATPVVGFPVLLNDQTDRLRLALERYLREEERFVISRTKREPIDRRSYDAAWEDYASCLREATTHAARSSYGRRFSSVFWLFHSIAISRLLKETPKRILRYDLHLGREQGDIIKYKVFDRFVDRVLEVTYDVVHHVAAGLAEEENEIFPWILESMRDNVLILTEDHINRDLEQLASYFQGYLKVDPKDFHERLNRLSDWHNDQVDNNKDFRLTVSSLLEVDPATAKRDLLRRPGYTYFLASRKEYDAKSLLPLEMLPVWENLLLRLKQFELLAALRRRVVPIHENDDGMTCPDPRPIGEVPRRDIHLSASTRPLDFATPWVVDPQVHRFGLIYDITDFSEIVSVLKKTGRAEQDLSYRQILDFQRAVNNLAARFRLTLEKYLGDGALYSGRDPYRLLRVAIRLQRHYRAVLNEDFPFDRGMRMALNHSSYRLLPIQADVSGESHRYEFFGHGIVELSRLVSGKATREIDETKTLLLNVGYAADQVDKFFAPLMRLNVDLIDKTEESRRFYAYINSNGGLVNEGLVATAEFIEQLDLRRAFEALYQFRDGSRSYVVLLLGEGPTKMLVGIRKLGRANFKGLGALTIYELVDADVFGEKSFKKLPHQQLIGAIDEEYRVAAATVDAPA